MRALLGACAGIALTLSPKSKSGHSVRDGRGWDRRGCRRGAGRRKGGLEGAAENGRRPLQTAACPNEREIEPVRERKGVGGGEAKRGTGTGGRGKHVTMPAILRTMLLNLRANSVCRWFGPPSRFCLCLPRLKNEERTVFIRRCCFIFSSRSFWSRSFCS